jgi:hypothetical protein
METPQNVDPGLRREQIEALRTRMEESQRWATLNVSLDEVTAATQDLCVDLRRFDRAQTIPLLGALLTIPGYQSNCIRLELLVVLAVMHCRGNKTPNLNDVARWYSEIGKSPCVLGEDPAEDLFVTLIQTKTADYRMLEGIWESAGFSTQRVVDVVMSMPDEDDFANLKRTVLAILTIADIVCERAGLRRYQQGSDARQTAISPGKLGRRDSLIARVSVSYQEIESRGIFKDDLAPFIFPNNAIAELGNHEVGLTSLDRHPLIDTGSQLIVALPTSITTAVREFVLWTMSEMGLAEQFDRVFSLEFSKHLRDTSILGDLRHAPIVWRKVDVDRLATFSVEIDKGYWITFHMLLPSITRQGRGGFKTLIELSDDLMRAIRESMSNAEKSHETASEFRKGIHLIVGCGWGKGYDGDLPNIGSNLWKVESIGVADLTILSKLEDMGARRFWRYEEGLNSIRKSGIKMVNANGVLNLFGWMNRNRGHFVPHSDLPPGRVSPSRPVHLRIPTNMLLDLRAEVHQTYDRHSAWDTEGQWHDVQRLQPRPMFPSESVSSLYACMDCLREKNLVTLYHGKRDLWLELSTPNIPSSELYFRLWEMASEWLHRIGAVLDQRLRNGPPLSVRIIIEEDEANMDVVEAEIPESPLDYCSIELREDEKSANLKFSPGFVDAFRDPRNIGESALVEGMLRAFLSLAHIDDPNALASELKAEVVHNDTARSFHMFHAHELMDYVQDELPHKLIVVDSIDDAMTRLGIGWRAHDEDNGIIDGRDSCTSFLNRIVDLLVEDILAILRHFDRHAIVDRLLLNCLDSMRIEQQWKKTSGAIIGLHGDKSQVRSAIAYRLSEFAGASICSRVLIEMALCTSPLDGGAVPAEMELGDLLAKVSLLIHMGGLSDGIHYNALQPIIRISALGDILFRDDFGDEVVEPTLVQAIGDAFVDGAPRQRRNYSPPEWIESTREQFGEEFWQAWIAETGVDIDQTRKILDAIEWRAIEDRKPLLKMRRQEFLGLFEGVVEEAAVLSFIEQFELVSRPRWDTPPAGFKKKEIFPWRFGRRLSLVARPLIRMDLSDDPLMVVAPSMLRLGVHYVLRSAYHGTLDQSFFVSDPMRNAWRGRAGEGHTYNHEVALEFEKAGWAVREGVSIPEVLKRVLEKNFGDVDVLAWNPESNQICIGECKDLSQARNYSEIAALLSDYQGKMKSGKPDKLLRHLERVRILKENIPALTAFTRIHAPTVVSALFASGVVPMQYAKIDALKDTYVGSAEEFIEQQGIRSAKPRR